MQIESVWNFKQSITIDSSIKSIRSINQINQWVMVINQDPSKTNWAQQYVGTNLSECLTANDSIENKLIPSVVIDPEKIGEAISYGSSELSLSNKASESSSSSMSHSLYWFVISAKYSPQYAVSSSIVMAQSMSTLIGWKCSSASTQDPGFSCISWTMSCRFVLEMIRYLTTKNTIDLNSHVR